VDGLLRNLVARLTDASKTTISDHDAGRILAVAQPLLGDWTEIRRGAGGLSRLRHPSGSVSSVRKVDSYGVNAAVVA
jgi:hypothetical protein